MNLVGELRQPFERMTRAEASASLTALYGIEPDSLELLDTERDDSFRVRSATREYVFKVAHPEDDPLYVNLQTAAMSYAAEDPSVPVQSLVLTLEGDVEPLIVHAGHERVARLMTWLDGELLENHTPTAAQLALLGATLGRLSAALASFDHPASRRTFAWDVQSFGSLREQPHPRIADEVFDRFAALDLSALPHQVIHHDFHPGNVIVATDDPHFVVGVLDFGDVVHSARVVDLGVSLAYLLPDQGDTSAVIDPFVAGYSSVVRMLPEERAAIPALVAARAVQRIILGASGGVEAAELGRRTAVLDNFLREN